MEYLVRIGDSLCQSDFDCHSCPFSGDGCDRGIRVEAAKKWLAGHPKEPEKPVAVPEPSPRCFKGATRGEAHYSLTLSQGRLSLFCWHGEDSETMDFPGSEKDFNQFAEVRPESWFDVAAKMIEGRKQDE